MYLPEIKTLSKFIERPAARAVSNEFTSLVSAAVFSVSIFSLIFSPNCGPASIAIVFPR